MKITSITAYLLSVPETEKPNWTSHFKVPLANEILVRLSTDEGIEGFGLTSSYKPFDFAVSALKTGLGDLVIGEDPLAPERLFAKMFGLTTSRTASEKGWSQEAIIRLSAAVDIAAWDIVGKAAGLPLYRLFGGFRNTIPAYVTCAYYQEGKDLAKLRDEIQDLVGKGHQIFKCKFGGLPFKDDLPRLELVRQLIGPDRGLIVDVNRAWDLPTAIEGARMLEPLNLTWLEEPVQWQDDRRMLNLLRKETSIPLSAGENEFTAHGSRAMLEENAVQFLQFDCLMSGGFTEGRKIATLCEFYHVHAAPHHDCFLHAHIVAGSSAGYIVESFDPARDPLSAQLFEDPPTVRDGVLTMKEQAGLGLTLSEAAIAKYGKRIL